ncbi:MAG: RNA polymerase-associated protein RapA [Candidatus Thiodiazotropha sp. (ex Gloverina cf. vestifex)]|nr:RNA polymerase-associated protein RapA [Candidatus Thiodiazotropha sp. (ex Gloverina cf. vestifex)]
MPPFIPGQRWISDTESELGLGRIVACEGRRVTLHYSAVDEQRVYALQGAPLTRVVFAIGDRIKSREGWHLQVEKVQETDGLITYEGHREDGSKDRLPEEALSDAMRISQPKERMLAGQIDPPHWFNLRYRTLNALARQQQSSVLGLGGPRIDLIPHQLYIAHEVANRPAPRVLLADEVGLGKTIEACLILHHQLITGRVSRALILVPDPLVHQWLVELLRRFNLRFRILDEETCEAIQASGQGDNPFHAEQLVLCSLDLFHHNPARLSQALDGAWDLLIVDEAHHLTWSADDPSAEYLLVESLALTTPGVLLLTATPEQLGQAGHFARLRLLDPDRYYDLETFLQEEQHYQPIAEAAEYLLKHEPLPEAATRQLLSALDEGESANLIDKVDDPNVETADKEAAREGLIRLLLDRHGTGRVMLRNTRARISGFPQRVLHTYPLPRPEAYETFQPEANQFDAALCLTPERRYSAHHHPDWWQIDPRLPWLVDFLRQQADTKLLLICAHAETAIELQEALRVQTGIPAGLFHEGMSIIERDRAAAWFADPEGARLLICSEIGSEGRNFQFAHHLVLFDLPADPDLLEQRIGRLDRIGQREQVQLHVPYLEPGPQSVMLRWYRDGLNAFSRQVQGAQEICESLSDKLWKTLEDNASSTDIDDLVLQTQHLRQETEHRLQQGRDHLLELGACRQPDADDLVEYLRKQDRDAELHSYLYALFDSYNIETEIIGEAGLILRPGEQVIAGQLPGLPAEGLTTTLNRNDALSHEDRHFLTWEHPLVTGAMEQVINQQTGNSTAIGVRHPQLKAGQLMLETLFVVECLAPAHLHVGRFLPPTLIRILITLKGTRLDSVLNCSALLDTAQPLEPQQVVSVINSYRKPILHMLEISENHAQKDLPGITKRAVGEMMSTYTEEIERMTALKRHNPSVRGEEIRLLQQQGTDLHQHLQAARLRLDALRLIVTL